MVRIVTIDAKINSEVSLLEHLFSSPLTFDPLQTFVSETSDDRRVAAPLAPPPVPLVSGKLRLGKLTSNQDLVGSLWWVSWLRSVWLVRTEVSAGFEFEGWSPELVKCFCLCWSRGSHVRIFDLVRGGRFSRFRYGAEGVSESVQLLVDRGPGTLKLKIGAFFYNGRYHRDIYFGSFNEAIGLNYELCRLKALEGVSSLLA
ncbi:hypothetical protein F2Q68_00043171 [Brassica cretica]|uniref:Uncharacterized protein n=1 Tax=Brassica cretica TaxID=69181 RepID=A0A8S9LKM1_BRACR|nr:hypothetical protein F2Q68_00043171 [Brassica cretica]